LIKTDLSRTYLPKLLKRFEVVVMAWNDWIARHPKKVLLAWLIIIVLMAPLAGKLSEVTNYSEEQMVSHHIESCLLYTSPSPRD
jgi:hypothetical protein